jgi:tetratricopeptide (TPR) repeat protein
MVARIDSIDKASDLTDRINKCERILQSDPNSQIFAALAEAYRKQGDLEKAFHVCQNGLRVHPSYGSAHVVMAKINMDRGLYDWAETEINKAIEIEGTNRAVELLLAEVHIYRGEFNAAVKLLRKLHQADPSNDQIKKLLDIALRIPQEQALVSQGRIPAAPVHLTETPSAKIQRPQSAAPVVSADQISAGDVIRSAVQLPDVDGALFFNAEGLVIESEWSAGFDAHAAAATLTEVGKFLDQELVSHSFGRVNALMIETKACVFYLLRKPGGMFLFVCNPRINLGTLRMRIPALVERFHA